MTIARPHQPVGDLTRAVTKRALLSISHAMERAFDAGADEAERGSALVLALFQRRCYFDIEATRYAALARSGATVVVGFAGDLDGLPEGVHGVGLDPDEPLAREWSLVLLDGALGTALVSQDSGLVIDGGGSLERSRRFEARWTFLRREAVLDARRLLTALAARLPGEVTADAPESLGARLEHARLAAETDQLTGLHNRHFLDCYLAGTHTGGAVTLSALLVDVDDLKGVNDTYGHAAGDAAILLVGHGLRDALRPSDVVVRWGGDEFLVLLPGATEDQALMVADRVLAAVNGRSLPAPWQARTVTASVGVSRWLSQQVPLDALDEALEQAKRSGKARARLRSDAEDQTPLPQL